jgi:hypothetical protein
MAYAIENAVNDSSIDEATENLALSPVDGTDGFAMTESCVRASFLPGYRQMLREQIAHTVMAPGDIEDELCHLIAVIRT